MKVRSWSLLAVVFTAALAQATILPPGSTPAPPTTFNTPVTGPFLADTGLESFSATNSSGQTTISGKYEEMVYSDPGNEFCAGCLDFFVVVANSNCSLDDIVRITLAAFGNSMADAGYTNGKGSLPNGVDPNTVERGSNGDAIGFSFSSLTGIAPGQVSEVLEIETNATSFMKGTLQIVDSSVASVTGFAPCGAMVPEAGSIGLTLLGGALLGIVSIARRRRNARS